MDSGGSDSTLEETKLAALSWLFMTVRNAPLITMPHELSSLAGLSAFPRLSDPKR